MTKEDVEELERLYYSKRGMNSSTERANEIEFSVKIRECLPELLTIAKKFINKKGGDKKNDT